ncbi:YrhB domain-containing protein [Streptomyces antarcticus]|uniref:YrhB domain-containing protein n=1 Tax=Streptomyces antarcticus TaxID=2996458 RepID=UPI00226E38B2|nr:YrhB domain-containing protein [Streptomyces sp. H34-AA3]MCY0946510.1 YrhB domain-containing protein [Streptomyces sp. H34-AA3]
MIDREIAVQIVEEQLARDYEADRALRPESMLLAVAGVKEHELVWIVSWTSEEYLRTRNPDFMLAGNGPYLVDRLESAVRDLLSGLRSLDGVTVGHLHRSGVRDSLG